MSRASMQRTRRRRRLGLIVLRVEVPDVDWPETLIAAGFLDPNDADDTAAIARATELFIASAKPADIYD